MTKYDLIVESLNERVNSGEITLEFAEVVNEMAFVKYCTEDSKIKETLGKVKDTVMTGSGKYVDSMGKRGEAVAKVALGYMKPNFNSSEGTIQRYQQNVNRIKTAYKVGEIVAIAVPAFLCPFGPTGSLYTAILATGLANSTDPGDKKILEKLNGLKSRIENIKNKIKNVATKITKSPVTEKDKKELDTGYAEGLSVVKQMQQISNSQKLNNNNQPASNQAEPTKESANNYDTAWLNEMNQLLKSHYESEINDLIFENGLLTESYYDILTNYIIEADYNNENLVRAIDSVIEKL